MVFAVGALLSQVRPGLAFVDFLAFQQRAHGLLVGTGRWVDPQYPLGYPLVVALLQPLVGDVLWVGKALAVAAGVAAVVAAQVLRRGAGWWLLALPATLAWGSTEGTDMAAAALGLAALAAADRGRSGWAGALAAAACLTRYTAVAVVPVAVVLCRHRPRFLVSLLLCSAPHWATALWTGVSVFPDQSYNLAIAAGRPTQLVSVETLLRWPHGIGQAVGMLLRPGQGRWLALGGAAGLLFGAWHSRPARALAGWALLHLGLVSLAFSNERLLLPTVLCLGLGWAWLLPRSLRAGLGVVGVVYAMSVGPSDDARLSDLAEVVAATAHLEGPVICTDPWYHQRKGGWLKQPVPPRAAGGDRQLGLDQLVAFAQQRGFQHIIVEPARIQRTYPQLKPLLGAASLPGLERRSRVGRWRVWRVTALTNEGPEH